MIKDLLLYSIVFVTSGLAVWQTSLAWLAPVSLLVLLAGTTWLWRAEGHSIYDLGLRRVASWHRSVCLGISIGLTLPIALVVVQAVSGWITLAPTRSSATSLISIVLPAAIKMALVAAVEELGFRAYFLQHFSFTSGTRSAMLLSSLLWALLHLPDMINSGLSPASVAIGMVTFAVLGAALSAGFLHTGNTLWFPFGLHYGYDLSYSFLGGFITVTYQAPRWLVGHPAWAPESGLSGLLLAATTLVAVWWTTGQKRKPKT